MVQLPKPTTESRVPLERALSTRRSLRAFKPTPVSIAEVAQLLWAAQGMTSGSGLRTAPSAGGLYPLELRLVAGDVSGLAPGIYGYAVAAHGLRLIAAGDWRREVAAAADAQDWVAEGAAVIAVGAVLGRATAKYGERGIRYAYIEVGHAAQNVYLQAAALGLGTTIVGAFDDRRVARLLALAEDETPLALLPVGRP